MAGEDASRASSEDQREGRGRSRLDDFLPDGFYRGMVRKLFRGSQGGIILSEHGREVRFSFPFVRMAGSVRRFEELREGMHVGFDVSWTSSGLRVSVIRAGEKKS